MLAFEQAAGDEIHALGEAGDAFGGHRPGGEAQQLGDPGAGAVHGKRRADLELVARERIARPDALDLLRAAQEPHCGDVVGDLGARIRRVQKALEEHPIGVLHLTVVPCHAPGHPLAGDARDQSKQLVPREHPARRQALGKRQVAVTTEADQVVQPQRAPERLPAARAVAVGRDHEAQRADQMRGGAQPEAPLGQGLPNPGQIQVLQIAQAAMDQLEGVVRGGAAEVGAIDDRDPQATQCGIARDACAVDAGADHQQIEAPPGQPREVSLHVARRAAELGQAVGVRTPRTSSWSSVSSSRAPQVRYAFRAISLHPLPNLDLGVPRHSRHHELPA